MEKTNKMTADQQVDKTSTGCALVSEAKPEGFRRLGRFLLIAGLVVALSACAVGRDQRSDAEINAAREAADNWPAYQGADTSKNTENNTAGIGLDEEDLGWEEPKVELNRGSGVFINEKAAQVRTYKPLTGKGEVTFNWEGVPIQEIIHTVLGDLLQENFVIGPGVKGKVTFSTARPINRDQVLPILEMVLRWNGATLVWSEDRYNILPLKSAVQGLLTPTIGSVNAVRGYEVRAVPMRYIAASEMEKLLQPYARDGAILSADNNRALLFIAGTRNELRNYMRTIETFDVDWLKGMSVGLFPLQRVEVATVIPELEALFGNNDGSPLAGMFRFMPMERLNSVMVITPQPEYLSKAREWIERLDRGGGEASRRLYVYEVRNLEAADLADYLGQIFGGTTGGSRSNKSRSGEVAPGLKPVSLGSFNQQSQNDIKATGRSSANRPAKARSSNDEDISIIAVEETNSLLIQTSPQTYDSILAAIKRLDIVPLQVHIEAQVLEVELNDELSLGVSWYLSNIIPELGWADGVSPSGSNDFELGNSPGGDFFGRLATITGGGNFVSATITALDKTTDLRVLSTPSLVVRNNEEANISVGLSLAVQGTAFNPGGTQPGTIQSNQYIKTGIELTVTPRVNPGGLVYLDVMQTVSSPTTLAPNGNPNINDRSITTKIAVQSGSTVLLGGLIREAVTDDSAGIPGLRRIPYLGSLFGDTNKVTQRTELLVMITPTVVKSAAELDVVTKEYQHRFRNIKPIRQGGIITLTPEKEQQERFLKQQALEKSN
ncbi:MAG: type II secretion system secretin GspD [Xanthomonadales bacterium]|nr:type II secretion system secretin GspD [Xanthomonadales bacterium]